MPATKEIEFPPRRRGRPYSTAGLVEMLMQYRDNRRVFTREEADNVLSEAARRLTELAANQEAK